MTRRMTHKLRAFEQHLSFLGALQILAVLYYKKSKPIRGHPSNTSGQKGVGGVNKSRRPWTGSIRTSVNRGGASSKRTMLDKEGEGQKVTYWTSSMDDPYMIQQIRINLFLPK